ncbi:uncharacterized protein LOC143916294 [Arctopsyche grandis]|uniref:uncharacterized protein LOC143916294 n=1 Tax=Arctopsyche grandis TaxID=121162 RepID=UPI00406D97D7
MSKQNKITSYFNNKNNSDEKNGSTFKSEMDGSNKMNKPKTEFKEYSSEDADQITTIDLISDSENDEKLKKLLSVDEEDQLLLVSLLQYESSQENSPKKNPFKPDDSTNFFTAMVEDFLSKPPLHHLFSDGDIQLIDSFSRLPSVDHRKLLVRIYWLQWKWYKVSNMVVKYLDIDAIDDYSRCIVELLQSQGFFLKGENFMSHEDWAAVLNKADLVKVCKHFKIQVAKADKGTLLSALKKFSGTKSIFNNAKAESRSMDNVVLKMFSKTAGECIKISENCKSIFDRLHLLIYLGVNPVILRDKQLNLMLMNVRNGQQHFPTDGIDLDCPSRIFPSKLHFEEYVRARDIFEQLLKLSSSPPCDHEAVVKISRQCYQYYEKLSKNETISNWYPEPWMHRFTPCYCYVKALEISIGSYKALKTDDHLNEALSILDSMLMQKQYRQNKRALWHDEKALILQTRFRQFEKAANVLITALEEKEISEDAKAPLKDRARRLARQKNINLSKEIRQNLLKSSEDSLIDTIPSRDISANSVDDKMPGKKARYVCRDVVSDETIYSSVEDYALLHYINNLQYSDGDHLEGRIITSIFVLLFWDIIYSNTEKGTGIFITRYQEAPLDLYTDGFYQNRKEKIEERLTDIESRWAGMDEIITFMNDNFVSRKESEVSLFNKQLEWNKLTEIVSCLGRNALSCICRRLALNYQYAHSGFPDLTVWNRLSKKIKFVEVKGDGDKLSHKQIQWMLYLMKCGIETEVCYVHKGTSKRKTPKKSLETGIDSKKKRKPKSTSREKGKEKVAEATPKKIENLKHESPQSSPIAKKSPKSPNKATNSNYVSECYLRSPTKFSRGVGFFASPTSSSSETKTSPLKSRKRLSLSLTRRRIFDIDK